MLYIFSTEENLSRELKLKRSYNFYDNNGSGKISQEEMVEALGLVHDIEPRILNLRILISFFHESDFYNDFFVIYFLSKSFELRSKYIKNAKITVNIRTILSGKNT